MLGPLDHYRYLTDTRRRLLERVKSLSAEQYVQEFPFGLRTVRRTLHHVAGAEWFLISQLRSDPLNDPPFSTRRLPDAASVETEWKVRETRTISYVEGERDWDRPVEIHVIIPSRQSYRVRTTAIKVFTQFCYHEVHHRSQVMAMLRQLGAPVETLDFLLLTSEVISETRV